MAVGLATALARATIARLYCHCIYPVVGWLVILCIHAAKIICGDSQSLGLTLPPALLVFADEVIK